MKDLALEFLSNLKAEESNSMEKDIGKI